MLERKVRVLCLHGSGSSNEIMKMQTAAIRYEMEHEAAFEFVEGAYISPSGDGTFVRAGPDSIDFAEYEVMAPSDQQFFVYYDPRDAVSLQSAQDEMLEFLNESHFDVVLGFSEGAALASSLMVRHALENPTQPPLFPCAIFLSGMPPLCVADPNEEDGPKLRRCQWDLDGVIIHEPTLHVIGAVDPWRPSNEILFGLCERKLATCILHPGGHEVPKSPKSLTNQIVEGIRDKIAKARLRQ